MLGIVLDDVAERSIAPATAVRDVRKEIKEKNQKGEKDLTSGPHMSAPLQCTFSVLRQCTEWVKTHFI
jgi:hypothetical protein